MSRHRAASATAVRHSDAVAALAGPSAPPGPVLTALQGPTELERLCGMVLAFPLTAERLLTERRVPDPVLRYTLLAETGIRLGKAREAVMLARDAAQHAARESPIDPSRLLPAATVLTDAAVMAGAPHAVDSCVYLIDLADQFRDELRAAIAAGLHAVAVFQQGSCRHARRLLDGLRGAATDGGIAAAAAEAHATIEHCCARRGRPHWPPATLPVITAGGWVQSALTGPFLADRFMRWPGIHDCPPTTGGPA
jgi:hypothetical protein